ncbi:MAG TPA: hypothetical protein PKW56_10485 [Clostridiales bacterium]|nr:hypothetical protein [Clostridiales bacterium]
MKLKYAALALVLVAGMCFPAKLVITGFKDTDPKTEFITDAFVEFLRGNLEEAGFELMDDRTEGLEYELLKQGNFYLASNSFFDTYENLELDNSINGEIKYKGKFFYLTLQVYSREKRRLVMKGEVKGSKDALLAFYFEVTKNIIASMDVDHKVKNVFPVDEDKYFYKYIKLAHETDKLFESDDPDDYYELKDELEAMQNLFTEYPVFEELYKEVADMSEDYAPAGPFEKPFSNITKTSSPDDNEIENYVRSLLSGGYIFSFREVMQNPVEDRPDLINMTVKFDLKLKKSASNELIKEIKKRKGNPHFSDMGRFFFSANEKENKIFRDFLLEQTVWLRFYDSEGLLIAEAEYYFDKRAYNSGAYRHAKILPFPLTPRGPANTAFGMRSRSGMQFEFEDIKKTDLERIASTEIELVFE